MEISSFQAVTPNGAYTVSLLAAEPAESAMENLVSLPFADVDSGRQPYHIKVSRMEPAAALNYPIWLVRRFRLVLAVTALALAVTGIAALFGWYLVMVAAGACFGVGLIGLGHVVATAEDSDRRRSAAA